MSSPDPLDHVVEASASALGLTVDASWRPEVRHQLATILRLGATVTAFPLPDDTEPAPVFRP
jgi:hypothetical protein